MNYNKIKKDMEKYEKVLQDKGQLSGNSGEVNTFNNIKDAFESVRPISNINDGNIELYGIDDNDNGNRRDLSRGLDNDEYGMSRNTYWGGDKPL